MRSTVGAVLISLAAVAAYGADPVGEAGNSLRAGPLQNELYQKPAPIPQSWKWSVAGLAGSQGLDIASSYGMRELNPLLAGPQQQFGMKAVMFKVGVTAAAIGVEYLIVKVRLVKDHGGAAKALAKINWSAAALTTGFATHNWVIR